MQHSHGQARWRERFERDHRHGIPCLPINRSTNQKGVTMARTITLPVKSNAVTYGPTEVIDVLVTLWEAETGNAVVIDDEQDTEPKARVRTRNMVALLDVEGFTITADEFPADFEGDKAEYECDPQPDDAEETMYFIPGMKARTHVVPSGDKFIPALSRKAS